MGTDRVIAIIDRNWSRSEALLAAVSTELDHLDADELMVVADHDDERTLDSLGQIALGEPRLTVRTAAPGTDDHQRLELGLFTRPLPDRLLVLGRGAEAWEGLMFLSMVLYRRPGVAGITSRSPGRPADERALLAHGGIFDTGALCAVGGFVGTDGRPLQHRLRQLGHSLLELTAPSISEALVEPAATADHRCEQLLVRS